ncbi:hypothetical protein MDOR_08850 [Mycolicibacterium doricum]|uniref:Uncharacterized protein n=1 Tax=Mycolicibacterium doricum TaxID=126673 RepID=A0A7I7VN68_9MYCO|nr:hypothetical protein [Mycolicibacterium doricum]MCV7267566.1 hypothetical protein [Mycolicibacterium doricum]BBZ06716.1 hypothetical protein MDOR_08850 [Mycolicibacterium doricum]
MSRSTSPVAADVVEAAVARLDIGGALVLAGSVMPGRPVSFDPESLVRNWWTIGGGHNYEPRHLEQVVAFLHRTRDAYPWAAVVSDPVGLDDIDSVPVSAPPGTLRAAVAP